MKYMVCPDKKIPAYLQLYGQIKSDIVENIYKFGERLPSKRLIADECGVSTVTAEHAYALLCDEGYAEARERSGFFVIFRKEDGFVRTAEKYITHTHIKSDSVGEETQFPISLLAKTMRRVISDYGEGMLRKSENTGCAELRKAIKSYLAKNRGINASAEQVIIGSGSEYLYRVIIELLGREHIFAAESPSYKKIEQVYNAEGARYEMLPLTADGIDSSALKKSKADVLHITPYRSFPSGVTATASKRHEYIRWAEKKNGFIVEDDFESEFSVSQKPEETLFSLSDSDNVIYMNTFSKTISPALRVGYMVLPERLVNVYNEKLGFCSCTVPTFEQLLLAELIVSGDFERNINRVRRKKRRELLK